MSILNPDAAPSRGNDPCGACRNERGAQPRTCERCRADLAAAAAAGRPLPTDRRIRSRAIAGGSRATDPPLTTRECADWMGLTASWVRAAIDEGVTVGGRVVRLEAETLMLNGRRINRIHLDRFVLFLAAIGWKRIPKYPRRVA
jgi:hypothetical protein